MLNQLKKLNAFNIWLISISLSMLMTESIVCLMEILLLGKITYDYLITGFVASLFVASLIVSALFFLLGYKPEPIEQTATDLSQNSIVESGYLSSRVKIVIGYFTLVGLLMLGGVGGLQITRKVGESFDKAVNQTLPVLSLLDDLRDTIEFELSQAEARQHQIDDAVLLAKPRFTLIDQLVISVDLDIAFNHYAQLVDRYFPGERDTARRISTKIERFKTTVTKVKPESSRQSYLNAKQAATELIGEIDLAIKKEYGEFAEQSGQIWSALDSQRELMYVLSGLSILIAIFGSMLMIRHQRALENEVQTRTIELSESLKNAEIANARASKSLALVEATLESTDNGILVVSLEGNVVSANQRFAEMWQIPDALLTLRDDHKLLAYVTEQLTTPADFINKVIELYDTPAASSCDTLYFKDGRVFSRVSHPEILDGAVVGRVWSFLDITLQHNSEKNILSLSQQLSNELRLSEQQRGLLESLLIAIPDLVWVKDPNGVFLTCNPSFEALYGCARSEIIGKTDYDFVDKPLADFFRQNDQAAIAAGKPTKNDEWLTFASDGYKGLFETIKTPVFNSQGALIGVLGVARDVTQLRTLLDDLEKARNEAQQSNEAKSSFLANMSHEIRTPMNAIIGMTELCLKTSLNDRQRNYVNKIQTASDSLLHIINDILDFSKIESGNLRIESTSFTLENIFDQLSSVVALKAEASGIELSYDIEEDNQVLIGDPLRLGQVLTNLVANALKFSAGGNVVVTVSVVEKGIIETILHFSVNDEGIGMSPEQLDSLFQPFTQADASTTRKFGGTGLGLAISRRLVGLMGGEIWAESVLGSGSTFHFTVRLRTGGADRRYGLITLAEKLAEHADRRILVVDDCRMTLRIMTHLIEQLGLKVDAVESANAALALVNAVHPSDYLACFVDWRMPEIDGIETIKRLRLAISERGHTVPPMILVTLYSHHDELLKVSHEIDGLLAKPVISRHLYYELAQSLGVYSREVPTQDRRKRAHLAWSRFRLLDILLVEDIEVNQEVIMELLESVGLTVRLAKNGVEALEEIAKQRPHLVLMDCQMPIMDGYTCTEKLRQDFDMRQLPIIALTASALASDVARCFAVGMNTHVAKPIRMDKLYEQMVYCLPNTVPEPIPAEESLITETGNAPTLTATLPEFSGIDMAFGLVNVGGRVPLFLRVLKQFRDNQGENFARQFIEATTTNDWKTLKRLAHSMKGTAQTIGALDLGDAAASLLEVIEQQDFALTQLLFAKTIEHLNLVTAGLTDLDRMIEDPGLLNKPIEANAADSLASLDKLAKMLQQRETEAFDFALDLTENFSAEPMQSVWTEIRQAIERYDFTLAITKLQRLRNLLKKHGFDKAGK